ncbi:MAG TPA: GNAT family N-acetyltransferase [Bacilli bacterium]|nr:GNAT family N-acetyltransferase [Bacilli bacterium]
MAKIHLKRITPTNVFDIIKLSETLTEYQKKCVAHNAVSLAQAYTEKKRAWPRAIYLGNKPIGFVMVALWDDDIPKEDWPSYYLWRMMIAKNFQGQGHGTKVLDMIVAKCREDGIKTLYVSCETEQEQPYKFYIDYGFIDTGRNDGEQILKMSLQGLH